MTIKIENQTLQKEQIASKIMQNDSFKIVSDLGVGNGKFTAYGCDLSYEYVRQ